MSLLKPFLQGAVLGLSLILPGISGGTAFLILGIYYRVIDDLASLYLRPYIFFLPGTIAGAFLGADLVSRLWEYYPGMTTSFLLGALVASSRILFKPLPLRSLLQTGSLTLLAAGGLLGWFLADGSLADSSHITQNSGIAFFLGGLLSSATMLLPGISGSSILIIIGLYENMLAALRHIALVPLLTFGLGGLLGLFGFSRFLRTLFYKHNRAFRFTLVGLILGSSRSLFPETLSLGSLAALILGAALVWFWSERAH